MHPWNDAASKGVSEASFFEKLVIFWLQNESQNQQKSALNDVEKNNTSFVNMIFINI